MARGPGQWNREGDPHEQPSFLMRKRPRPMQCRINMGRQAAHSTGCGYCEPWTPCYNTPVDRKDVNVSGVKGFDLWPEAKLNDRRN